MAKSENSFFKSISEVISLYVSVLAIIAILATIGVFSIRGYPEVKVLRPIYLVNMARIFESTNSIEDKNIQNMLDIPQYLNGNLSIYGKPKFSDYRSFLLPYERVGAKPWQRSSNANPQNFFYRLGIEDTSGGTLTQFNTSAYRNEDQKITGLIDLIGWDRLDVSLQQNLRCSGYRGNFINPLVQLKRMRHSIPDSIYQKLVTDFSVAASVYSIISISNNLETPMEQIRLIVNDVIGTGQLKIIGWTAISPVVDLVSEGPNFRLNIERIDSEQSFEILFRGWKLIREEEISVSISMFSGIRKNLILSIMLFSFLLVIAIYWGERFLIKRAKKIV